VVGQHSRDVLREYAIPDADIDALADAGVIRIWTPGDPILPTRERP
jgi:hypothetical protein